MATCGLVPKHVCNICENRAIAEWFCGECGQILCDSCKQGHMKARYSQHHKVNPLDKLQTVSQYNLKADVCEDHDRKRREIYCKDCDLLICSKCLTLKHKHHRFEHKEHLQGDRQEELEDTKQKIIKHLKQLNTTELAMASTHEQRMEELSSTENKVNIYAAKLRQQIDSIQSEILTELSKFRKKEMDSDAINKIKCEAERIKLTKLLNEIETKLENQEFSSFRNGNTCISLQCKIGDLHLEADVDATPTFNEGPLRQMVTKDNFGGLRSQSGSAASKLLHQTRTSIILKELPVRVICPLNNEEKAWIAYDEERQLTLVDNQGTSLMKKDAGDNVEDATIDGLNNLFICFCDDTHSSRLIKKFHINGKENLFAKFRLDVVGLCSNGTDIFASLKYRYHASVARLSNSGQVIQDIAAYDDESQLYNEPGRMTFLPGGTLVTIDQQKDNAKLIAVDEQGKHIFTWKGRDVNPSRLKFWPFDVSHDKNGRILITDGDNNVIYVLDDRGQISHCLLNQEDVTAIAGTGNEDIWVGDMNGVIRIIKITESK